MSPLPPDPYKILGVSKDAQIAEIRSAHRKLVLKCHPDKVQDPEQKALKQDEFQKVQQAYEILSDEKERQKYDDTARLAELRKQMANKANISVSRSSPKYAEFEIRTAEPSSSYKSSSSHTAGPGVKVYTTTSFSRSWEDDRRSGPRYYDAEPARSSRREATYSDRPSKRESEKEREREKDRDSREKRKKREKEDELRREKEKEEKKREKEREKKQRDKQRSKEMKRDTGEKRRETSEAYIESYDDEAYVSSKSDKKKSSRRKDEEKRERSSHRDRDDAPPKARHGSEEPSNYDFARAYIQQSQKSDRPERTHAYHAMRTAQPPAAPTPPPADSTAFHPPEEEIRRSAARPRHGSGDIPNLTRERSSYNRPSRERLDRDDPIIVSASPTSRGPSFPPKMSHPEMSSSPPHVPHVHRTNTMPMPTSSSATAGARPIPSVTRSNTFAGFEGGESPANRGRGRSRQYPQVPEETESEDDYDRRAKEEYEERKYKDRKHRSSKKHRSPERGGETRYHVENGRAKMYHQSSYSRKLSAEPEYYYEATPAASMRAEPRPSMSSRDYSGSSYKVKTSKHYGADDIQYSSYQPQYHREDYGVSTYA